VQPVSYGDFHTRQYMVGKTCFTILMKCENTEIRKDLKPLAQYEETCQLY